MYEVSQLIFVGKSVCARLPPSRQYVVMLMGFLAQTKEMERDVNLGEASSTK
jgi:hypothetical protein